MSTAIEKFSANFLRLNSSLHKYRQSTPVHKNACTSVLIVAAGPSPAGQCFRWTPEEPDEHFRIFFEPSPLMGWARHTELHPQNLRPGRQASNCVRLKAQHRSRARAQELMVTVSGKGARLLSQRRGRRHISDLPANAREIYHASTQPHGTGSNRTDRSKIPGSAEEASEAARLAAPTIEIWLLLSRIQGEGPFLVDPACFFKRLCAGLARVGAPQTRAPGARGTSWKSRRSARRSRPPRQRSHRRR